MTVELQLLLYFEDWPPLAEEIEYALGCEVLEYVESEVD